MKLCTQFGSPVVVTGCTYLKRTVHYNNSKERPKSSNSIRKKQKSFLKLIFCLKFLQKSVNDFLIYVALFLFFFSYRYNNSVLHIRTQYH